MRNPGDKDLDSRSPIGVEDKLRGNDTHKFTLDGLLAADHFLNGFYYSVYAGDACHLQGFAHRWGNICGCEIYRGRVEIIEAFRAVLEFVVHVLAADFSADSARAETFADRNQAAGLADGFGYRFYVQGFKRSDVYHLGIDSVLVGQDFRGIERPHRHSAVADDRCIAAGPLDVRDA